MKDKVSNVHCGVEKLREDEKNAWAAFTHLKETRPLAREELLRLEDHASGNGFRLKQHLLFCECCNKQSRRA
jgi:hypothetical protein